MGRDAAAAAPALAGVLESGDERERLNAALALGSVGSADSVPGLVKALKDREESVRDAAAQALGMIGPPAKEAVRPLLALLEVKDERLRVTAAEALWRIDRHPAAIAALARMVEKDLGGWRAARVLRSIGPDAAAAVPALTEAIHAKVDLTGSLRRNAALALGQIGPAARKATPSLRRALRHSHSDLRVAAAEALWRLEQDRSVVPVLVAAVRHREARDDAIEVLGRIGPAAEEAVPDLIYALKDDSTYTRTRAARALGQIGPKARAAIAALKDTLYADEPDERRAAALALKQIDPDATKGPSDR
jgi:HEAT repeat protein